MKRVLVIPAAGRGSRLQSSIPKILFPVAARPMVDYLFDLYSSFVDRIVLVLHPDFAEAVRQHCAASTLSIDFDIQVQPTGMLDAILIPRERLRREGVEQVWITWCDQIAVSPGTVRTLAGLASEQTDTALLMPTIVRPNPYIHLQRNARGEITDILHRRENDVLPDPGEGDLGLFCLSQRAYFEMLPAFAEQDLAGLATRERNFLPFIPWLTGKAPVVTFPVHDIIESVGVNDAEDLRQVEEHFAR